MTTPTICTARCSLHSQRGVHIPCRHCEAKHIRLAPAARNGAPAPTGQPEASDVVGQPIGGKR